MLLSGYAKRKEKAELRLDEVMRRLLRAAGTIQRYREEIRRYKTRMAESGKAMSRGELYPPLKVKKAKPGRRIEID